MPSHRASTDPDATRIPHEWTVLGALRSPKRLKTEVLAGLVVALALIPEAIAFSIIAGVDPRLGLFASFTMAVTIAFVGGRPAMISAATGAVALDLTRRRSGRPSLAWPGIVLVNLLIIAVIVLRYTVFA